MLNVRVGLLIKIFWESNSNYKYTYDLCDNQFIHHQFEVDDDKELDRKKMMLIILEGRMDIFWLVSIHKRW